MTSLIDVIFLLLLFFMLTSTFSRYAEVELASPAGAGGAAKDIKPVFVQLTPTEVTVNARPASLETLPLRLQADRPTGEEVTVVVALKGEVTAQRLTDMLIVLKGVDGVRPLLMGAS